MQLRNKYARSNQWKWHLAKEKKKKKERKRIKVKDQGSSIKDHLTVHTKHNPVNIFAMLFQKSPNSTYTIPKERWKTKDVT